MKKKNTITYDVARAEGANMYNCGVWTLRQSHEAKSIEDSYTIIGNLLLSENEYNKMAKRRWNNRGLTPPWEYDYARHRLFLNWRLQDYKLGKRKRTFMNTLIESTPE